MAQFVGQASGAQVVSYASTFLGIPYVWGGASPGGFDCSGLVQYVYKHFGISLPRTSEEQAHVGVSIPANQIQPGDILFYNTTGIDSHEALYIGGGKVIAARMTGLPVMIVNAGNFTHAQRVLGGNSSNTSATPAGYSVSNASLSGTVGGLFFPSPQDVWNAVAGSIGVSSITDAFERLGLILFGGGLIVMGVIMTSKGSTKAIQKGASYATKQAGTENTTVND